jgi:sulfur carrier protein
MTFTLNGNPFVVAESSLSVLALLDRLNLTSGLVAVEHNHRVVAKDEHALTVVQPGDTLEIVTFVGGG